MCWVFAGARANQWELSAGVCCEQPAAPKWCFNNTYFDRIMTFLWRHQMGTNTAHNDAKSDATQHAPTHTNTPASIPSRPHPQNCNQTPFRGASGSILKILCILKLPNKKEKFVFIIQNSFQLSRRDCEVFNKQNSAAALGRGRNTTTLLHSSNKRTKEETENCSQGESRSSVHRTDWRTNGEKFETKDQQV